eukprot:11562344-Alexandrium_andersonii.AAC.1
MDDAAVAAVDKGDLLTHVHERPAQQRSYSLLVLSPPREQMLVARANFVGAAVAAIWPWGVPTIPLSQEILAGPSLVARSRVAVVSQPSQQHSAR